MYRYGYFQQSLSLQGDQIHNMPPQEFTKLPVTPVRTSEGEWLRISVEYPGRTVHAKVWLLKVGRISRSICSTQISMRIAGKTATLTHQLYGGNNEHRLKQEILLGIGGVKAVKGD